MIRCRFRCNAEDPRPISWPVKHPYWVTGIGVVVAYADNEEEIKKLWPDAYDLDSEDRTEYTFTGRFPKPEWFNNETSNRIRTD